MKDRVTYESQALYVGPARTGVFGDAVLSGLVPTELQRIQNVEHYVDTNRENIHQLGSLNALGKTVVESPRVGLEFTYILGDAQNEKWLGFNLSDLETPAISGFLSGVNDEQNFYLVTKRRGDIVTTGSISNFLSQEDMAVYSFGNGVIENYTLEASLFELPQATVAINATNVIIESGCSGIASPSVNLSGCADTSQIIIPPSRKTALEVDSLRAPNITLTFGQDLIEGGGALLPGNTVLDSQSTCSLESFSLEVDLERLEVRSLGNSYVALKKIDFPVSVSLDCVAKMRDIASGNLIDIFCSGSQDILIEMNNPNNSSGNMKVAVKAAHLQDRVFDHNLLTNETVNLSFVAPLSAADVSSTGFYISGVADTPQETTYGITNSQLINGVFAIR